MPGVGTQPSRFQNPGAAPMTMCVPVKSARLFVCIHAVAFCLLATESKPDELDRAAPPAADSMVGKEAGQVRDDNGLKMKLVWCRPGEFTMGSPKSEIGRDFDLDDEGPVAVTLTKGFWLGKYEVTQQQYRQVVGTNPSDFSAEGNLKERVSGLDTEQFPVEMVTWDHAMEFCRNLTGAERRAGRLPSGWEYTLSTEAQWEYACRAGTTAPFSFGIQLNGKETNCDGNYPYGTTTKGPFLVRPTTVGSYSPNHWDLHDMHGNVSEWCRDGYKKKLPGETDPFVSTGRSRITRGGAWNAGAGYCRSAHRLYRTPTAASNAVGFRVALSR
jgi:formylglycine-generating enzyme required for sulfatase activity